MRQLVGSAVILLVGLLSFGGCSNDDDDEGGSGGTGSPDFAGQTCNSAADCYPEVDPNTLKGQVLCLDKVPEGYCTHLCGSDADCCAVDKECKTELKEVCSPFENTGQNMCFLSCESGDIFPAGTDENEFCQRETSPYFECRSSGGGRANRKICMAIACKEGEACAADADCDTGLVCNTEFKGGYCAKNGCSTNAECGANAYCTRIGDTNYCLKRCTDAWQCAACRPFDLPATCRSDVQYVDATSAGSVCVPP